MPETNPSGCVVIENDRRCGRPTRSKNAEWCEMHYYRARRHGGDPTIVHKSYGNQYAGQHPLGVIYWAPCKGCGKWFTPRRIHGRGYVQHCSRACGCRNGTWGGTNHWAWTDTPQYEGAHGRIRAARGNADDHACLHCGVPAAHWALDHSRCSEPLRITTAQRNNATYSVNPHDYIPLCARCHSRMDHRNRQASVF
jgi:hypothetical protein